MPNGSCRNSSRMLKKAASGVLASLRGSTYRTKFSEVGITKGCLSVRQDSFQGRTAHTKCGLHLIASSLAAALLNSLFEHPDATRVSTLFSEIPAIFLRDQSVSAACLAGKRSVSF